MHLLAAVMSTRVPVPSGPGDVDPLRPLMARVALRDRDAFERLYRATSAHLFSVARRMLRDETRADEVLQDAYVSIWLKAPSYRPDVAAPMTWMINIVRNRAIDALRSCRRDQARFVELDDGEAAALDRESGGDPRALLEASLLKTRLERCLLSLPAGQRQALALAYYRGMAHAEIADTLSTPLGTVKTWLRRGLEQLRRGLDQAAPGR